MEKLVKQILKSLPPVRKHSWSNDWALKLISLFFAIFLWYFVVGEDKVDVNLLIPIEIVNLPRDLVISNQYKRDLDVTVSGSRGLIRSMSRQNLTRTVDLSDAEPGTTVIRNTPESLPLPRGIRVMRIQPTHLIFQLDRLVQRKATLVPTITGSPPEGYELVKVELDPDYIMLNGPDAVIGDLTTLKTEEIDVSKLSTTETRQVNLNLKPDLAELIGESIVTAKIIIQQKMDTLSIAEMPITLMHPVDDLAYFLDPATAKVDITVPDILKKDKVDPATLFSIQVDVQKLSLGRHTVPIEQTGSDKVVIRKVSPPQVQVDVSRIILPKKLKIRE